jgi:ubiquinone/menaquinone biosynthesis C-methylase UbiE
MEIDKHKKQFGNLAEDYSKYRKPYTEELYKLFFSLVQQGNKKILDIACGTGKSTEPLVRDGFEVFGCDHDPLMIEEAQKQAKNKNLSINYSVAEVEQLPFEDQYFDVITVGTAFHWFVNDKAITEIKRVLKSQGLFFIFWTLTIKDIPEEDEIPSRIFRSYNWDKVPSELRDLGYISNFLTQNGLKNVSTARIPFTYNTTVEERVGLQKTASAYELLSEENKEKFLSEVTEVLTKKLGNRTYFTLEEEIQVCYGFKD